MEQELIKDLNKEIIKRFNETKKILEERIKSLKSIIENENTNEKLKNNIEIVIEDLKKATDNITTEIKRMEELDREDKAVFYGEGTFGEESKYSDKLTSSMKKNASIKEEIGNISELKNIVSSLGSGKTVSSVNKSLESRIEKLKTKQGKIAAKQRKIVNKATEQKLREYLGKINTKDIERQNNNEKKIAKRDEEIYNLNIERKNLGEIKGKLLGNKSLISKGLGIKVAFDEKLTQARINRLKAKRGILKFRSRHMIQANVNKNLIARMKYKVKALGESIKSGIAGFKKTYEEHMNNDPYTSGACRAK